MKNQKPKKQAIENLLAFYSLIGSKRQGEDLTENQNQTEKRGENQ